MPDRELVAVFGDPTSPLVVAHRGASLAWPENTLPSFEAAIAAGADAVELDVRLTADGVPVISHDADVSRRTDGSGFVHELTLAEIKRLDAGGGAEVPTLLEALDLLTGRAGIDIEIKNIPGDPDFDSPREALAEEVVKIVDELEIAESVLVSSFNWLSIERVRDLTPGIATGFLTTTAIEPSAALAYAREKAHPWILPMADALLAAGEGFVGEAHAGGMRVGTWTVDDPERMRTLFGWGVDAVATNDPATAVAVRASAMRSGSA